MTDPERVRQAYCRARDELLAARLPAGYWVGRLSSSALSTATATSALSLVGAESRNSPLVGRGLAWLREHQNPDGGWGDTDQSFSNIATTMLARAAFHLAGRAASLIGPLERAAEYIESAGGVPALKRRYGRDKTFAVPILTNCALAGLADWGDVAPLPFELACVPYPLLRFLRLPVVSYAVPALVAIGQARYFHRPPLNPLVRLVRRLAVKGSLRTLQQMQPASGGYLEAVPLTSFVVMSLAAIGQAEHPVVRRGVDFLLATARDDGSWPIDTNLATWNTTLAIGALAAGGEDVGRLVDVDWLLGCQHRDLHPFTHAAPGGWGWSDSNGAVPDADDTAGALLALAAIARSAPQEKLSEIRESAREGIGWLLQLQNRDGGWPTFCRGWGTLPFDRSGVDLTAHALRALHAWRQADDGTDRVIARGLAYLRSAQRADGAWVPLWFGNQYDPAEENPVYGTSRVLLAYRDLGIMADPAARRAVDWLFAQQRADGGWGPAAGGGRPDGVSSVEETAVAVEALLAGSAGGATEPAIQKGLGWLVEAVQSDKYRVPSPIGFYFARLWYYESLYPLVFCVSALASGLAHQQRPPIEEACPARTPADCVGRADKPALNRKQD